MTHQPEIGMVIDRLHAHCIHEPVKALGSRTLKKSVGVAFAAYPVDDVTTGIEFFHHLGNGIDVILEIGIDRHGDIGIVKRGHQSGHQSVLMAHIAGKFQASHVRIALTIGFDEAPSVVTRAVVDVKNVTPLPYQPVSQQAVKQGI